MPEIAARLAMDPVRHVDPARDLVRPFSIPGQVFGQMSVALGRINSETPQDVDPHLFLPGEYRMSLEGGEEFIPADAASLQAQINEPCLVIYAGADIFEIRPAFRAQRVGDLGRAVLDAVTEAERVDLAVLQGRPGIDRHRVGVVQEQRAALRDLANVAAEIENDGNVCAGHRRIPPAQIVFADALVDAVFQGNPYVVRISFDPADPHAADDVAGALVSPPSIGRRGHFCRQLVDSIVRSMIR